MLAPSTGLHLALGCLWQLDCLEEAMSRQRTVSIQFPGNVFSQIHRLSIYYLVWREVVQQLLDVVRILGVPVLVGPLHTVGPSLWPLQDQAALYSLQYFQRLGAS